jgi:3alpha(or 20beta)-hydroxysteroid dehydrogenase
MSSRVEGRVALVTGAARGQGAALGRLLAGEGARVRLGVVDEEAERFVATLKDEEVSLGVSYLTSDESAYVTGTELAIDPGYLAGG